MKVVIGCDHAGYDLKQEIMANLKMGGYEIADCGTYSRDSVDYPDIAESVAAMVLEQDIPGIVICGTGIGASIAANKVSGIRAALCDTTYTARLAREHNNANIIALGARVIGSGMAIEIVNTFLNTSFAAGRHQLRVEKIIRLENTVRERS